MSITILTEIHAPPHFLYARWNRPLYVVCFLHRRERDVHTIEYSITSKNEP